MNSPSVQLSAAPIPRLGSVCDDSVCRVPKLDQPLDRRLHPRRLTGATIARSFASGGRAGGAAPINATADATASNFRMATLPPPPRNWHLQRRGSRGAATPNSDNQDAYPCLRSIDHFIGGSSFASGERQGDVFDPNQGEVQAHVRLGTAADLQKAVDAAKAAQPGWAATNPQRRARVMFKFKELVEAHMDELAAAARRPSTARSSPTPRATSSAGSR